MLNHGHVRNWSNPGLGVQSFTSWASVLGPPWAGFVASGALDACSQCGGDIDPERAQGVLGGGNSWDLMAVCVSPAQLLDFLFLGFLGVPARGCRVLGSPRHVCELRPAVRWAGRLGRCPWMPFVWDPQCWLRLWLGELNENRRRFVI